METTTTLEIPCHDWPEFCDAFSRQHERWVATVEVLASDLGAQVEANRLRFEGISAEAKDGEYSIALLLGEDPKAHVTHAIFEPTHIRLERTTHDAGTFETLEIESSNGTTTLVRFQAGVIPEMLDGFVEHREL